MATIEQKSINYLKYEDRVFLPSEKINIFPCSRRGQSNTNINSITYYDPEARLNTERTNRIGSADNGFTDSFIKSYDSNDSSDTGALTFILAGYHIEINAFKPAEIAGVLGSDSIYAHLGLHTGISLQVGGDYATEILYRQATGSGNSLDVKHSSGSDDSAITGDFFVGVSFTSSPLSYSSNSIVEKNLLLFTKSGDEWVLKQASLLPHIEHGGTEDSIKINGTLTVNNITSDGTAVVIDKTLKVDTIDSNSTNGLTIKRATKLEKTLTVDGDTTVNDTITAEKLVITRIVAETDETTGETVNVDKGEIVTPTLRVNRITTNSDEIIVDDKNLVVTKSLEVLASKAIDEDDREKVAVATIDKAVIGELIVTADDDLAESSGKITAKEVAAEKITQNGNPIPVIALSQIGTSSTYQLQITLDAAKKED